MIAGRSVDGDGFAPFAYDRAIRAAGGAGSRASFGTSLAATAEWDAADSGVREGAKFPDEVDREGTSAYGGTPRRRTGQSHGLRALLVPPTNACELHLTGGLPAGIAGSIALVGFDPAERRRASSRRSTPTAVSPPRLNDPGRFARSRPSLRTRTVHTGIGTATRLGLDPGRSAVLATVTTDASGRADADTDPTPTATPTVTPTPTPTPRTSLVLSRSTTRIASAARTGFIALFARTNN